jgi:hypothetical protein
MPLYEVAVTAEMPVDDPEPLTTLGRIVLEALADAGVTLTRIDAKPVAD